MARPQDQEYESRRLAIVEAAAHLFATRGFASASLADLAEACNISKSNIYHYFAAKEDILFEAMNAHVDLLVEDAKAALAAPGGAAVRFAAFIHAFLRHYVGAGARQKVLLNELANLPEPQRREIVGKQRFLVEALQSLLVALDPTLAADPARARAKTMLVFGMINWAHTWYDPNGAVDVEGLADLVLETLGLAPGRAAAAQRPSAGAGKNAG